MMSNFSNFKHSDLTGQIIKEAYHVYNTLGYGFLESVYEKALAIRLRKIGIKNTIQQLPIQVYFEGEQVGDFRADLAVNDVVIIELKAVKEMHEKHEVQLVNYLKATKIEVGLVINFGEEIQIKRRVFTNEHKSSLDANYEDW
ncbi:MAG: GxxExxY protein [Saprospiraceae bacterium]